MTSKSALRRRLRHVIEGLGAEERARQSRHVFDELTRLPALLAAKRVGLYLSRDSREICTQALITWCVSRDKRVFLPRIWPSGRRMEFRAFEDFRSLETTRWALRQPREASEEALAGGLDVLMVPLVAFTESGQRLGNGGGFYDSWLPRLRARSPACHVIGLAFREQRVDWMPSEAHDSSLDAIVYNK